MSTPAQNANIRIASYNMRKARGLDQRRNPGRIVDVINMLGADIVALQEADRRMGDRPAAIAHDMIASETDFEVVNAAPNDVSLGWHGNAVLVRKGTRVTAVERLDLPGLEPRGAVRVTFGTDAPMSLFATHLGLTRGARRKQLNALRHVARQHDSAVIVGDFNEWSPDRGFEALRGAFEVHSPGRSFHARRPVAGLDRIALSKGVELRDAGVEQGPLARRASDHLPIWADIAIGA